MSAGIIQECDYHLAEIAATSQEAKHVEAIGIVT
jgi:hypothetical protein